MGSEIATHRASGDQGLETKMKYYLAYQGSRVEVYASAEAAFASVARKTTREELPTILPSREWALSHLVDGDETRIAEAEAKLAEIEEFARLFN